MSLQSVLQSGKFVVTAEVGPLKGTDTTEVTEVAELLQGRVDATNVTDQQSSVMRLGSLATCHLLKENGVDPVFQMTCRDRNRLALQSDLLSAYVLGIENVLAITGDLPSLGDHPQAKPVYDLDSVQLLWVIKRLNEGYDTCRMVSILERLLQIPLGVYYVNAHRNSTVKVMSSTRKTGVIGPVAHLNLVDQSLVIRPVFYQVNCCSFN